MREGSLQTNSLPAVKELPAVSEHALELAKEERAWSPDMAVVLATRGNEGLLDEVTDDLLEGCRLTAIAERFGVRMSELARFLYVNEEAYRGMLRVKADLMAHETLHLADQAGIEDVAVQKLRIDTRFKLARHWNKEMYGDKDAGVKVDTQITIVHASE